MNREFEHKWCRVLAYLQDNVGVDRFNTWFACAEPVDFDSGKLTLRLPSQFFMEKYEHEFYNVFTSALRKEFGPGIKLSYDINVISSDSRSSVKFDSTPQSRVINNRTERVNLKEVNPLEKNDPADHRRIDSQLNESLTFENYCVGDSNRLPVSIAEFIANNPGKQEFNPFFLYGDVGVGKTHLIHAIGIRIRENNPAAKVLFMPMRQFQNMVAKAYMTQNIPGFINWFQQIDALLFDDLQELTSTKTRTMEVLFAVFNHLHQHGKTLVFTCDRPPVELDGMTDRLIDRFKWGITERLPKPDFALRKKILQFKASKNGLDLNDEIISLIAEQSEGSVRELEGIVMGILTRSISLNAPITPAMAREVMKHSVKAVKKSINFDMIVEATADYYRLNPDVIFSKSRVRDIADARQVIMYLAGKLTKLSSVSIGHKLNREHTTVLHGIQAVKDRIPFAHELANAVEQIECELKR